MENFTQAAIKPHITRQTLVDIGMKLVPDDMRVMPEVNKKSG